MKIKAITNQVSNKFVLRDPAQVMKLDRLGAFHQTRISFARTLIRRMANEKWSIKVCDKKLDKNGFGYIVYSIRTPQNTFTFSGFSNKLSPTERSDRVIAEKWDATFTLSFGHPKKIDIKSLSIAAPLQELGRFSSNEFMLSRANKSVRLFELVVDALANGKQPSINEIRNVGYLMRTTAVYGNGKFGLADYSKVNTIGCFNMPFQAEMLSVYMTRQFTFDLVNHCALSRGGSKATKLARPIRKMLGIGNATGLGMAPFLINHPRLLNDLIRSREIALARVRNVTKPRAAEIKKVNLLVDRTAIHLKEWITSDSHQQSAILKMIIEFNLVKELLKDPSLFEEKKPWNKLIKWSESHYMIETQELINSILMEPYGELVDDLEVRHPSNEIDDIIPGMLLKELGSLLRESYAWVLDLNYTKPIGDRYFWYRSEEKQEPRLGDRYSEIKNDSEIPLAIARDVVRLMKKINDYDDDMMVAEFLIIEPNYRRIVRRTQSLAGLPYAEIRENLISENCEPIDILRCKLSFFGATKFDPKSKLWTRINLFQGAPLFDELKLRSADDWFAPIFRK